MTKYFINEVDIIDGKAVGYDTANPSVTYPVQLLDKNGNETDDLDASVGGVVSFAEDYHQIFCEPGDEWMFESKVN